jgi:hypothetical protein
VTPDRDMRLAPALALCALSASVLAACGSAGNAQLPVPQQPLAFVDAVSKTPIERVLIVPKYTSTKGVSTGAGHGPGYMKDSSFLAFPFVYRAGTPFEPAQPDSKGMLVGPLLFVGEGVLIDGVVAIAPGYRPTRIWQLWDRAPGERLTLEPLGAPEAAAQDARLRSLFETKTLRSTDMTQVERDAFNWTDAIDVRFSDVERQTVRAFLTR